MIEISINNIDVTDYITEEDPEITVSAESAIDLLCYNDNFTLEFSKLVRRKVADIGGQDFEVFYYGEQILVGQIIKVTENSKDTVDIEFGTIDYLCSQATFSLSKGKANLTTLFRRFLDTTGYDRLLNIDDSNEVEDFGAYYTYNVNEVADQKDIGEHLKVNQNTNIIKDYQGFFQKFDQDDVYLLDTAKIWGGEGSYNASVYKDNYYFGHLVVGRMGYYGEAGGTLQLFGVLYNIINGDIDFGNPIEISIEKYVGTPESYVFGEYEDLIVVSGQPYKIVSDRNAKFEVYKFYNSFNWDDNERQDETKSRTMQFLNAEIESKYYTAEQVDNNETDVNMLSLFYDKKQISRSEEVERILYENTLFVTAEINDEKYLLSFCLGVQDIFYYYFDDAKGKELLSDIAVISDNIIIFRGNKLIIADRDGYGHVEIPEKYIDADISTEYIIVDREKLDSIGSSGGYNNGIVVLDLEFPFNVADLIRKYFPGLQSGQKQTGDIEIPAWGLPTKQLIGKTLNDYGTILEVNYKKSIVSVRTEKRV